MDTILTQRQLQRSEEAEELACSNDELNSIQFIIMVRLVQNEKT